MDLFAVDHLPLDGRPSNDDANGEPAVRAGFDPVRSCLGAVGFERMVDAIDAQGQNLRPPGGVANRDGIAVTSRMARIGRDTAESWMQPSHCLNSTSLVAGNERGGLTEEPNENRSKSYNA